MANEASPELIDALRERLIRQHLMETSPPGAGEGVSQDVPGTTLQSPPILGPLRELAQGAGRALIPPEETLLRGAKAIGIAPDTTGSLIDQLEQARTGYDAASHSGWGTAGQVAGTLGYGGPITKAVSSALLRGSELVPALSGVAKFVTGGGGTLSSAAAGAGGGALINTLSGESPAEGAAIGGAAGLGLGTLGAAYRTVAGMAAPFTQSGQENLANRLISKFAGPGDIAPNINPLIPGSEPTLAQSVRSPGISGLQRTMYDMPKYNPQFVARDDVQHAARNAMFDSMKGSPKDLSDAIDARDAAADQAVKTLFQPGQSASTAPVVQVVDDILAGPGGKREAVKSSLGTIRGMLVNKGPNNSQSLETDPAILYQSVRKQIGDMLDKRLTSSNPAGLQASRELLTVRDALDQSIEDAVPGFGQFRADYASASRPIDAMSYLQGLNLTDNQGQITLGKTQAALRKIASERAEPGVNDAKSLTPQHLSDLVNLHQDLLNASNINLGKSYGSPTVQKALSQAALGNLPGPMQWLTQHLGPQAIGASAGAQIGSLLGTHETWMGALAGQQAGSAVARGLASSTTGVRDKVANILLNPSQYSPPLGGAVGETARTVAPMVSSSSPAVMNNLLPSSDIEDRVRALIGR